ncbi:MAG: hypothetical protein DRP08_06640, partial [Candidatus Aenigmatarchaeota archaeon]
VFRNLYEQFTYFTNLYQFPVLSNQEQATELYQLARKSLEIEEIYREYHEQLDRTYHFLEEKQTRRLNRNIAFLTRWGIALGLTTVVATLLPPSLSMWDRVGILLLSLIFAYGMMRLFER